jgi:glycosyltransferase involved in cell wall biosynthesis
MTNSRFDLKCLVILTSEFPYSKGETFLENEFPFLESRFSSITILTESNTGVSRIESEKTTIFSINNSGTSERISVLLNLVFWKEIIHLLKNKKLTTYTFRTAWYSLSKALLIKKTLEQLNKTLNFKDILFYSYWLDEKAIALSLLKKQFPNVTYISRAQGWDLYQERDKENYLPFRNFILNELDFTLTISKNGKDYLSCKHPQFKEKINVSRLGTLSLVKNELKNENDNFNILSLSAVIPLKRVDKILNVISQITDKNIQWTHIGDGPLFESIKKQAKEKGYQNPNFSFSFLGQKTNTEVREFLSAKYIDLFINLSETEGIPVSIMEAQSAGIPVLATAVGGTPEIVNDQNGILVDKDEKNEIITQKMIDYFNLPKEEKQKKRELSFQNWKENYNAETNYTNFIQTILDLPNQRTTI